MNNKLVSAVEKENDRLEEPALSIETESQLACGAVIVEVLDPYGPCGRLNCVLSEDAVLQC